MKDSYFIEIHLGKGEKSKNNYDNLYSEHNLSQMESFYIWFYNKIGKIHDGNLLDIACGEGEFLNICNKKGISTFGIDISHIATKNAKKNTNKNSQFSVSTGENLPFKNDFFDFVSNIGSLEHFENLPKGVCEMSRVLKKEGRAFILVPNTFSLTTNIWNVIKKGEISIDDQPTQRYGTRNDWENLIKSGNFEITKVLKYERPFPKTKDDLIYYIKKPKELIRLLISPFIPKNLCWCFLFICEKK